jgi:ATP-dependent protease HslVU (ClpYQ) peptidase subunit
MTICVAALCDDGQSCVVAADRMAVFGGGSLLEFKLDNSANKIHRIGDTAILLHAGRTRDAETLIEKLPDYEIGKTLPTRLDELAAELIQELRDRQVARLLGPDCDFAKLTATAGAPAPGPLHEMWQQIRKTDFGDMLLVLRESSGCSIHAISPPVLPTRADLDYASVGSGRIYAVVALTIQQYSKRAKISEALFQVYSAKRAAELVYGVGEPTDMAILASDGIREVSEATLKLLEKYRKQKPRYLIKDSESKAIRESLGI